jgi:flagellar basal body-associated protein FliL
MAEEQAQKEVAAPAPKKSKKMMMIGGIVAGILVLEGAFVFILVKMMNKGPTEAMGVETVAVEAHKPDGHETHEDPTGKTGEVVIANQFECPHTNTGRLYVIRMTVYATVPQSLLGEKEGEEGEKKHGEKEEEKKGEGAESGVQTEIAKNIATIKDRMRTIIAGADPGTLCLARSEKPDYGLSTLRRQIKTILDDVLGKGKVKDVLISDYMPTPMD